MAIFFSPNKTIALIKNAKSIEKEMRRRESDWFFTDEGRKLYEAADTDGKKTAYFYEYLVTYALLKRTELTDEIRQHCLKKAYIMTAMDKSNLSFASYPSIMKKESNPIIEWEPHSYSLEKDMKKLICDLHGVNASEQEDDEVYKIVSMDKNNTIYTVERLIVSLFTQEKAEPMKTIPFKYSILSKTSDSADEIEEEVEEDDE